MNAGERFSGFDADSTHKKRVVITVAVAVTAAVATAAAWAYWPKKPLPENARADLVVVRKKARSLSLYAGSTLLKRYRVALGSDPYGHKQEEGDGRTPEGKYVLDYRKADSAYHRSLHISYPSVQDRITASEQGVNPGGMIMVHGVAPAYAWLGRLPSLFDWTAGCVAVSNPEMDEIWRAVPEGTPIVIEP